MESPVSVPARAGVLGAAAVADSLVPDPAVPDSPRARSPRARSPRVRSSGADFLTARKPPGAESAGAESAGVNPVAESAGTNHPVAELLGAGTVSDLTVSEAAGADSSAYRGGVEWPTGALTVLTGSLTIPSHPP